MCAKWKLSICQDSEVLSGKKIFFCLRSADCSSIFVMQREMPRETPMPTAKSIRPMAEVDKVTSILFSMIASHICFAFFLNADSSVWSAFLVLFSIIDTKPFNHDFICFLIAGCFEKTIPPICVPCMKIKSG